MKAQLGWVVACVAAALAWTGCANEILPPVADAGNAMTANMGESVVLDAGNSKDPQGRTLGYDWTFLSRPDKSRASFNDPHAKKPSFVPDFDGAYIVQLVVNNGVLASAATQITISVRPCGLATPKTSPSASVGGAPIVAGASTEVGATVALNANATDADNGDKCNLNQSISYEWSTVSRPSGSSVALSNPTAAAPTFVPDVAGTYQFEVVATDSTGLASALGLVQVSVARCGASALTWPSPAFTTKLADPEDAAATVPNVGTSVTLTAHPTIPACRTAAGGAVQYTWSLSSAPSGSTAALAAAASTTGASLAFVPDVAGSYEFSVVASDSLGASSPAVAIVSTTGCGSDPVAVQNVDAQINGASVTASNSNEPVQLLATLQPTGCPARFDPYVVWDVVGLPPRSNPALSAPPPTTTATFEAFSSGTYTIRATAINASGHSGEPGYVTIDVSDCGSHAPVIASAGGPGVVAPGVQFTYSATATDQDAACGFGGAIQALVWSVVQRPADSTAALINGTTLGQATFTPDRVGTYVFQVVALDDLGFASAPVEVTVSSQPPVVTLSADNPLHVADGTASTVLTVKATTADGLLPAFPLQGTVSASGMNNVFSPASQGTTDATGTFPVHLASTAAQVETVQAVVHAGIYSSTSNTVNVTFVPVPVVAIATNRTQVLADGSTIATLTITATDVNGPVQGIAVSLMVSGTGNTLTPSSGTTDSTGTFIATLASTDAGIKAVTATAKRVGDPVPVNGIPVTIAFVAVPTVTLMTDRNTVLADGSTAATLTVTATTNGQPTQGVKVTIDSDGADKLGLPVTGSTLSTGMLKAKLSSSTPGTQHVSATASFAFGNVPVSPSSVNVTFVAIPTVSFTVDRNTVLADGTTTATFTVSASTNSTPTQGVSITVSSTGSNNVLSPATGTTDATGTFTSTLSSTTAELKTVTFSATYAFGAVSVPGKALITFVAVPTVTISADPTTVLADFSTVSTITVTAMTGSTPTSGVAITLKASGTGNTLSPASGTTDSNGTFTATLKSSVPEKKNVMATAMLDGGTIQVANSPLAITFVTVPSVVLTVAPSTVLAGKTQTALITVTATSSLQPLAGVSVSVTADGTGNHFTPDPANGTTDSFGVFTATLGSDTAEVKHVTATATFAGGSVPVTGNGAPVTFASWFAINSTSDTLDTSKLDVTGLAIDPVTTTDVFGIDSTTGVLATSTGGPPWSTFNDVLPTTNFVGIAAAAAGLNKPATLYLVDRGCDVFVSTSGGNWSAATTSPGSCPTDAATAIAADPTDATGNTVYVSFKSSGVWKSADAGATWKNVDTNGATALAVAGNGTVYSGGADGFVRALGSATATGVGKTITALGVAPDNSSVLVGLDDGSVWQSTDQAAHFGAPTTLSNDSPVLAIVFATKTSALLALTGSGNVFKTSDGGATFFAANLGLDGIAVNAFAVDPSSPDNVYAGTAHGFYETTRGGE